MAFCDLYLIYHGFDGLCFAHILNVETWRAACMCHAISAIFSNSRYLEKICYRCFFDSFRFFSNCLYPVSPFHGKRKSVKVYKQEGRNLSFVEVSSFKHGIFPISIIAYNTLILSYFHIIRCCSISKDTNFSANHNTPTALEMRCWGVVQ